MYLILIKTSLTMIFITRHEYFDITNNIVQWRSLVIIAKKPYSRVETSPTNLQTSFIQSFFYSLLQICSTSRNAITVDESCSICSDDEDSKTKSIQKTSCGHVFHKECISSWMTSGGTSCPMCRKHLF